MTSNMPQTHALPSIDNKLCARIKDIAYHDRHEAGGKISLMKGGGGVR